MTSANGRRRPRSNGRPAAGAAWRPSQPTARCSVKLYSTISVIGSWLRPQRPVGAGPAARCRCRDRGRPAGGVWVAATRRRVRPRGARRLVHRAGAAVAAGGAAGPTAWVANRRRPLCGRSGRRGDTGRALAAVLVPWLKPLLPDLGTLLSSPLRLVTAAVVDWLFGTLHMPAGQWSAAYGPRRGPIPFPAATSRGSGGRSVTCRSANVAPSSPSHDRGDGRVGEQPHCGATWLRAAPDHRTSRCRSEEAAATR